MTSICEIFSAESKGGSPRSIFEQEDGQLQLGGEKLARACVCDGSGAT